MTSLAEVAERRRALVVGTGLIGGSIALGLRQRGWHVSGLDVDEERLSTALQAAVIDVAGDDLAGGDRLHRGPGGCGRRRGTRPSRRRPQAARRGGHRRERGQDLDCGRGGSPALHRRSSDGRVGADGPARCRSRPLRRRGVGADADRGHRAGGLRPAEGRRDRPGRRCAGPFGRGPRPARGRGVPRASPGGDHADECGNGRRRTGPHLASPGGRRLS